MRPTRTLLFFCIALTCIAVLSEPALAASVHMRPRDRATLSLQQRAKFRGMRRTLTALRSRFLPTVSGVSLADQALTIKMPTLPRIPTRTRPPSQPSPTPPPPTNPNPNPNPNPSPAPSSVAKEVLRLVNVERAKAGLNPLQFESHLQKSAELYAVDMRERTFFSHTDPDGKGSSERIKASGYLTPPCDCAWEYHIGENLAKGQDTPAEVVQDWIDSPGHRANILSKDYKDIGIGKDGEYWVQHFGGIWVNE